MQRLRSTDNFASARSYRKPTINTRPNVCQKVRLENRKSQLFVASPIAHLRKNQESKIGLELQKTMHFSFSRYFRHSRALSRTVFSNDTYFLLPETQIVRITHADAQLNIESTREDQIPFFKSVHPILFLPYLFYMRKPSCETLKCCFLRYLNTRCRHLPNKKRNILEVFYRSQLRALIADQCCKLHAF